MRRHRVSVPLLALGFLLVLAIAGWARPAVRQAAPEVLRARGLELVDEHGRVRTKVTVEPSGEVVLRLFDQDGTIRVKLGAGKDGSGLVLLDDATEPGVQILAKRAGGTLTLRNREGRERLISP